MDSSFVSTISLVTFGLCQWTRDMLYQALDKDPRFPAFGDCGNQLVSLKRAVFTDPIGDIVFNDPNDSNNLVKSGTYDGQRWAGSLKNINIKE